jgi:hypothetical protein
VKDIAGVARLSLTTTPSPNDDAHALAAIEGNFLSTSSTDHSSFAQLVALRLRHRAAATGFLHPLSSTQASHPEALRSSVNHTNVNGRLLNFFFIFIFFVVFFIFIFFIIVESVTLAFDGPTSAIGGYFTSTALVRGATCHGRRVG